MVRVITSIMLFSSCCGVQVSLDFLEAIKEPAFSFRMENREGGGMDIVTALDIVVSNGRISSIVCFVFGISLLKRASSLANVKFPAWARDLVDTTSTKKRGGGY